MSEQRQYPPGAILPDNPLWALGQPEEPAEKPVKLRKDGKPWRNPWHGKSKTARKTKHADPELREKAKQKWRWGLETEARWVKRGGEIELLKQQAITAMWDAGMTIAEVQKATGAHMETVLRWRRGYNGKQPWPRLVAYEWRGLRGPRPKDDPPSVPAETTGG